MRRKKNSLCDIHTTVLQAKKDGAVGPFSCSFAVAAAYLSALVKLLFFFYRSCFCLPSALFKNSPSFRPLVSSLVFLVFRKRPRQVKLKQFKLKLRLCRQTVYCAIIMSTLFLFLLLACEIITLRFCFFFLLWQSPGAVLLHLFLFPSSNIQIAAAAVCAAAMNERLPAIYGSLFLAFTSSNSLSFSVSSSSMSVNISQCVSVCVCLCLCVYLH